MQEVKMYMQPRKYLVRALVALMAYGAALVITCEASAMTMAGFEGQGPPLSSSFPGPLWDVVAPVGGGASVTAAHMLLRVPGGSNHDVFASSNQAVRALQPIGNVDFDVSIKIDSTLRATDPGTSQGLIVVADELDFVTFALGTDGSRISLSAHTVSGGRATAVLDDPSFSEYQSPMYLRLTRSGVVYIAYYSTDGNVWTQAATFSDTHVPTALGPFAANSNAIPARAVPVTMSINWFDTL
jgi:hypothetical protein